MVDGRLMFRKTFIHKPPVFYLPYDSRDKSLTGRLRSQLCINVYFVCESQFVAQLGQDRLSLYYYSRYID